ncbi:ribonuclease Z [Tenacibaculum piscium]|uniref:ribonuclease Z n=1 Tax=Tenacibaculum piscium TaxID=1458515 RepID=UPI00187BB616|nr:ribonuclease Z [Tenacibaculum piscium]MBE7685131.1 ribonuclease Z [Tenacibaculum piscium]MBE7689834.1 ribonuclease Z [Tenacibaculum piscium]
MKIQDKTNYIFISSQENNCTDFFLSFEKEYVKYQNNHIIVEILADFSPSKENILLFLKYAELHQQNGTSFVIVVKNIAIDDFPEILNIVPTLEEAQDIIDMENMQRELGF